MWFLQEPALWMPCDLRPCLPIAMQFAADLFSLVRQVPGLSGVKWFAQPIDT